jgi:hypothetical protein
MEEVDPAAMAPGEEVLHVSDVSFALMVVQ